MRLALAVLLLAWASSATASELIWKCKGPKGALVYQNSPCAPGTTPEGVKLYDTPDHPQAIAERDRNERIMEARRQRQASSYGNAWGAVPLKSLSARDLKKMRCKEAKERAHQAAFDGTPDSARAVYERAAVDECFGL